MKNKMFNDIIIAGYGSISKGLLSVGNKFLKKFKNIYIIDKNNIEINIFDKVLINKIKKIKLDIENLSELENKIKKINKPLILINLCSGTDNLRLRKLFAKYPIMYIDACCSLIYNKKEYRYSKLMPYTFKKLDNKYPHFVCAGINPGLVEIIARKIIFKYFDNRNDIYDILFYEHDTFYLKGKKDRFYVSWSPRTLIDEVVLSPTFEIKNNKEIEDKIGPTRLVKTKWNKTVHNSRLVGHEEIWNLAQNFKVNNSFFAYSFSKRIMNEFNKSASVLYKNFLLPKENLEPSGTDLVAVKVKNNKNGIEKTMFWKVSHKKIWNMYKINGVQYQTALGVIFFLKLMLKQKKFKHNLYCASDFPINNNWKLIENEMKELNINFIFSNKLNIKKVD